MESGLGVTDLTRPFAPEGDRPVIGGAPAMDPATGAEVIYRMEFRKVPSPASG